MISLEAAYALAQTWVDAWNRHDLDAIMEHYTDDIHFWSPLVVKRLKIASGYIGDKSRLRTYFAEGLALNPELHFTLLHVFVGVDSISIHYRRHDGLETHEMMVLDATGQRASSVRVHYSSVV